MKVTVLGCGTSVGVPVIGCDCAVCTSDEPRNQRLRCGLRLETEVNGEARTVLIDTPPDLRQQALRFGIDRVDAVVYTHGHADHTFGIDELRIFNFLRDGPIPCYAQPETVERLQTNFAYVFEPPRKEGGGKPRLEMHEIGTSSFEVCGLEFQPVPLLHGSTNVLGFRLGRFAYLTDCNHIPEGSFSLLDGVELLIIDALRFGPPHSTHFTVAEAIGAARRIGARRTWLTHMNHDIDYREPAEALPPGVELAYDGLTIGL